MVSILTEPPALTVEEQYLTSNVVKNVIWVMGEVIPGS